MMAQLITTYKREQVDAGSVVGRQRDRGTEGLRDIQRHLCVELTLSIKKSDFIPMSCCLRILYVYMFDPLKMVISVVPDIRSPRVQTRFFCA